MQSINIKILKIRIFELGQGTSRSCLCHQPSIFVKKYMIIEYLLIKCNLTLLKASGARDIQSTTTILINLVYFLSTQSKVGKYLTNHTLPTSPPTMAHDGAYIRDRNKSIKIKFKYAGIAIGCAGCTCEPRIKKNFEARCRVSKVRKIFLCGVEQAQFHV